MEIEFIKEVTFKDMHGIILKVYNAGDRVSYTAKAANYWITPMGGIYFDEALEVNNVQPI